MSLYKKIVEEGEYNALTLQLKYDGLDEWVIPGAPAIQKSIVFVPVDGPVYQPHGGMGAAYHIDTSLFNSEDNTTLNMWLRQGKAVYISQGKLVEVGEDSTP